MASIIRMPGETDAEYSRRQRPLLDLLVSPLYRREIQKLIEGRSIIADHMRLEELRRSCGKRLKPAETFTWDVHS